MTLDEYILFNYRKVKTKEIAEKFNVSINTVYSKARALGVTKPLNPTFELTSIQRSIIIGGILGDGSFKKNGSNFYYRECHSIKEKDWLFWKFKHLYNVTTKNVYYYKARKETQNPQFGIQTVNSSTFNNYAKMNLKEALENLDELSFLVWLLDDGWHNKNNMYLSTGKLTNSEIKFAINKIKEVSGIIGHIINDGISFSGESDKIKKLADKYLKSDIDIYIKKIKPLHLAWAKHN